MKIPYQSDPWNLMNGEGKQSYIDSAIKARFEHDAAARKLTSATAYFSTETYTEYENQYQLHLHERKTAIHNG